MAWSGSPSTSAAAPNRPSAVSEGLNSLGVANLPAENERHERRQRERRKEPVLEAERAGDHGEQRRARGRERPSAASRRR